MIWMKREWSQWTVADCWQNSWVSLRVTFTSFTPGDTSLTDTYVIFWHLKIILIIISSLLQRSYSCLFTLSLFSSIQGFEFFETSAKDNINVKQTFERLVDLICDKMSESLDTDPAVTTGAPTAKLTDSAPPLQQPGCNC